MRKSFASSAIILIIAGFIARLFGFVYRIYLSNHIGAEGMGLFQLIVPVYTAIILTITAGISIAVSKMVAEQQARNNSINPGRITKGALVIVLAAGAFVSLFIFFNINLISEKILGDSRTYSSLLLMVPCIPAVVAGAALKGYFYGMQQVTPTAFSQIAEQAVKIAFVLVIGQGFSGKGVEFACAVATLSTALGEIANLLVLAAVYIYKRRRSVIVTHEGKRMRKRSIIGGLLRMSVPISANRLVVSMLYSAEYIMIPAMLVAGGLAYKSSMEIFGRLMGMALPLIMFPSLVTNSLATTLVPAISKSISLKNYRAVNYKISKSIQITFILGVIFTSIFFCYPEEIGSLVYKHEKIGSLLQLLSFSCVFLYLQQTLTGVLNGLGKQSILLRNTIIGAVLRIGAVYFLMPLYGIQIYIVAMTASFILNAILDLFEINKITGLVLDLRGWILKPGLVGVVMVLAGRYLLHFFEIFAFHATLTILMTLTANVLISGILIMMSGILKPDEVLKFVRER